MLSHTKDAIFSTVEQRLTYKVGNVKMIFSDLRTQFVHIWLKHSKLATPDFMVVYCTMIKFDNFVLKLQQRFGNIHYYYIIHFI